MVLQSVSNTIRRAHPCAPPHTLGECMIHCRAVSPLFFQVFRVASLFVVFCMACLMLVACAGKKTQDADDVRSTVVALASKKAALPDVPGLSVAVLRKGEDTPVSAAFGNAALENPTPLTTASRFKIGSVTKIFTATLIHRLIEEGKLDYNTPISRFFPSYPNGKNITVRNLLEHTSGIPEMLALAQVQQNLARYWPAEELISLLAKQPPLFRPGTRQLYSNTGFLMLAVITEKITGRTYGEQVLDMFGGRLGMKSLLVGVDGAVVPRLASGYSLDGSEMKLPLAASIAIAKGTGNLEATPDDVVRLVNLDRVLKNNVLELLPLKPLVLPDGKDAVFIAKDDHYVSSELDGCTLFLFDQPKIALIGKLGSFPGFGTAYYFDRETGYAVAVSVNNEIAIPHAIALGAEILQAIRQRGAATVR